MQRLVEQADGQERLWSAEAARLRRRLAGQVVSPDEAAYDEARKVWNGTIDRRPAMIVYCANADDVVEVVAFARATKLLTAVRSGGHNIAGASVCDGGMVIDLSRMKAISVDPERRVARAEAGLTLHEFDAATQAFGLATTMGVNGDTGIAGLTLGGGVGKLARKHGLTCDNVVAVEIVTADGARRRASAEENSDLFWGVRGGGGNFGIVTAFEYRLHPLGPTILRARLSYGLANAREAMLRYDAFAHSAPDEISADAGLSTESSGETTFGVSVCYMGPLAEGERTLPDLLRPLRRTVVPASEEIAPVPYLEIQSAADAIFPRGGRYYWKAQLLPRLTEAAIDTMLERFSAAPSPLSVAVLQHLGGAVAHASPSETAYAHRDALYDCFPVAIWRSPAEDEANARWARDFWAAMRPFSGGRVYVNNLGDEGEERVRAAYGANHRRLADLKAKYDPDNFFRLNQNITPALRA